MTKYIIPFIFAKDMNAIEICELLKKHNINIGTQTSYTKNEYLISGTMESLTKLIAESESEYPTDYVYENQVAVIA